MKYAIALILVILAYFAGYLTPKETTAASAPVTSSGINTDPHVHHNELAKQAVKAAEATQTTVPKGEVKAVDDIEAGSPPLDEPVPVAKSQPAAATDLAIGFGGADAPRPLTDEQIDKLVPAPFNQQLKGHDGVMLEKYRKFSAQEEPSSQDSDIYNKISDAIASNPYSKFLTIESFRCKANLCEIRLYESKAGVWSYIQAEMSLQEWWKFNSSSAAGFDSGKENISGWYVLLTRD